MRQSIHSLDSLARSPLSKKQYVDNGWSGLEYDRAALGVHKRACIKPDPQTHWEIRGKVFLVWLSQQFVFCYSVRIVDVQHPRCSSVGVVVMSHNLLTTGSSLVGLNNCRHVELTSLRAARSMVWASLVIKKFFLMYM